MSFFIIPSGESYCNDRSKKFSVSKNIGKSNYRSVWGLIEVERELGIGTGFITNFPIPTKL